MNNFTPKISATGRNSFKSFLTTLVLMLIFSTSWSQTATITIDLTSAGGSANLGSNAYASGAERTWTQDGVSFGSKATTAAPTGANLGSIQAQATNGVLYNTTALPGRLVSVVITSWSGSTDRASTLTVDASGRLVNTTTANYTVNGGTSQGASTPGSWTIASGDYTYLAIKRGASAAYWAQIVITYETAPAGPTVTTTAATSVSTTGADLNGTINANGVTTDASFEYGTTVSYGTSVTASPATATGTSATSIAATIGSLSPNTQYHYRAVGTVSAVPTNGSDMTFYTLANTPGVLVVNNPFQTTLDVTVNATTENSNPATTQYAIQETGGQYVQGDGTLGATAVWQTAATWATITVTGLTPSTTYTFQAKARNGANVETGFGSTASGTTLAVQLVDYAVVQFPNSTQNILEGTSLTIYTRVYEPGLTTLSGSQPNLYAWVGYSSTNDNPSNPGWTWVASTFNAEYGNDDEYQATLSGLTVGTYYYAARFQIGTGPYVYGGSGGIWSSDNVTLNVNPDVVDYANVQFPLSGSITEGDSYTVYAQVYEPSLTPGAGQGAGITAEIGYSTSDTTPDGTWTWVSAAYNASQTGSNDEYFVDIASGLTPGTYYYASRFIKSGSTTYVYGGTAGIWNNDNGVLTITTLGTPSVIAATTITDASFDANWNAVTDANSGYLLDVSTSPTFETTVVNTNITIINNTGTTGVSGWTETTVSQQGGGSPYLGLLASSSTLITPAFDLTSFSNINLNFLLRTFGGTSGSSNVLTVSISTNNGSNWTTLATRTAANNTLTAVSSFNLDAYTAYTQVKIRFQSLSATGSIGLGIDDITIIGDQIIITPDFVSGYNAKPITGQATVTSTVTGLAPNTQYYYRLRAKNGTVESVNSNTIAVTTLPGTCTWDGTAWSNVIGPDADIDAIIAGIYTTTTNGVFTAHSLTVNSGSLTINSGTTVTVVNEIVNNLAATNLFVENNANLLQVNDVANTGNIRVRRMSSALMRLDYTLWSSPVTGQNLQTFSPNTLATRFYNYNTTTNLYNAVSSPSTTAFVEGQGYLIRTPNNFPTTPTLWPGTFNGVPNNGDVNVSLTNIGVGQRFNLIGNPYPSPIDMNQFVADNTSNITGTLYFWRKTNSTITTSAYCTWAGGTFTTNGEAQVFDPNDVLRTGQGFIVEASATGSTVQFNNGQRIADNANQFFRSAQTIERNRMWINLTNEAGDFSQMSLGYIEGATQEVDQFDGKFLNDGTIAINTILDNTDYVIQGRALPFLDTDVVPVSVKIPTDGNYTITLDHVDGLFANGQVIYLKDNLLNTYNDISSQAYTFTSNAGIYADRFEIVYTNGTLSNNNPVFNSNQVVVYKNNSQVVINSGNVEMSNVKVFDIRGRLLIEKSKINSTETRMNVDTANEVLLIQITSNDGQVVTKKIVN